ncbi:MAG: FAD-dependent oxidoreductase [Acidimicrobiia bacterium]
MTERLVVVGGDAAGMSAASAARRLRGPVDLAITAFERGDHSSYAACGIPYFVGGEVRPLDRLVVRTPEQFRDRQDIEVRVQHEVVAIETGAARVQVRDRGSGAVSWESYDHLVVATGAVPTRPPLPGIDAEGIFGIQTLGDGAGLDAALGAGSGVSAVVVGGGYIGLEMAEALVRRGVDTVTLVEAASEPMSTLDPDMGALVHEALEKVGVAVRTSTPVSSFEVGADGHVRAVVAGDTTFEADVVVLGLGVRPDSALAEEAGIDVGPTRGIRTDRRMRTSAAGVWAAGDCVEVFHRVSRRPAAIALGTHANKQGRTVGINVGGGYATFPGVVGTAISKICEWEVARTGLGEAEAAGAGFASVAVTIESTTRAGYFPGAEPMRIKLVAERRSGRLLGAQIVGRAGAAKRIDALAVALWNEMTVGEIEGLDLAYAPPFAPVWDPVLVAARKAHEAVADAG